MIYLPASEVNFKLYSKKWRYERKLEQKPVTSELRRILCTDEDDRGISIYLPAEVHIYFLYGTNGDMREGAQEARWYQACVGHVALMSLTGVSRPASKLFFSFFERNNDELRNEAQKTGYPRRRIELTNLAGIYLPILACFHERKR